MSRDWAGLAGPEADPRPVADVAVPAHLLDGVLADLRCDRDRARGERNLAALPGTQLARAGDSLEEIWCALHPGYAAFLDWAGAR